MKPSLLQEGNVFFNLDRQNHLKSRSSVLFSRTIRTITLYHYPRTSPGYVNEKNVRPRNEYHE